jgi:hypothetical protein
MVDEGELKLSTFVQREREREVEVPFFRCGLSLVLVGAWQGRVTCPTTPSEKRGCPPEEKHLERTEEVQEDKANVDHRASVKMGHSHGLRSGTRVCLSVCDFDELRVY